MPYPKLMAMVSFCWKINFLTCKIKNKKICFIDDVLEINDQSRCILSGPPCIAQGGCCSPPPLDIFCNKSAARIGLAARFHEFFPYRFAHILRSNLWCPGVRLQSYVTFSTCMSAQKSLKFVILCTNPMQIGILEVIHITDYFHF